MHLSPELVDTVADYIAIFVLFFVPGLLIYLFWMVHILPEKIAERRGHPQADAIKTLCLLSLVFGGLLWPIAWLWAYSKPVFYKMAYGTDRHEHPAGDDHAVVVPGAPDLAALGSGHHGAAALGETHLPALGTVPAER
jgi:CBS domain containing-hemolysin-like protein